LRNLSKSFLFVEESIQELFVYITESGHRLGNVKNIKAYLFSSLRRNLLRYIELKRKEVDRLSEYTRRTDISFFSHDFQKSNHKDSESQDLLHKLLNELPWRQKEAIYLRFYNNLSTKDIAEVMNIANQTVLNMIYQALKKVKALSKV